MTLSGTNLLDRNMLRNNQNFVTLCLKMGGCNKFFGLLRFGGSFRYKMIGVTCYVTKKAGALSNAVTPPLKGVTVSYALLRFLLR